MESGEDRQSQVDKDGEDEDDQGQRNEIMHEAASLFVISGSSA